MRLPVFAMLVALGSAACAGMRPTAASWMSPAGGDSRLVGTWALVSTRITRGDSVLLDAASPAIRAMKLLNATDFSVIALRGDQFMRAGAGRYTLAGDQYVETVDLASGRYTPGREYRFRITLSGDTWTTDGGEGTERFQEVWRRVR